MKKLVTEEIKNVVMKKQKSLNSKNSIQLAELILNDKNYETY